MYLISVRLYLVKQESNKIMVLKKILRNSAVIHKNLFQQIFVKEKDTVSCTCYCDVYV